MKPFYLNIIASMSGYVMNRLDKEIDTEAERKLLAENIIREIEDKIGDIPLLNDEQELKAIEESLVLVHKGLSGINNLLNGFKE